MSELRQRIYMVLKENKGQFVSGERLARENGVSRAAVSKAVRVLCGEGCDIEAVTRQGYRLREYPPGLQADAISRWLKKLEADARVCCFSSIDSTNTEARRRAGELTGPTLFAADSQTAGRGRQGHTFYSPVSTGLYMTVAVPVRLPLQDAALATQAMAVAAVRAVRAAGGPELRVKWVNDLYYQGKKVAGILTEAISDLESGLVAALLCGIGYNLTTRVFPDGLQQIAGVIGRLDRNELAARTTAEFLRLAASLPDTSGWLPEYTGHSLVLGRGLSFEQNGQVFHAVGETIDEKGRLIVRMADSSLRTLSSGEISIRPDDLK